MCSVAVAEGGERIVRNPRGKHEASDQSQTLNGGIFHFRESERKKRGEEKGRAREKVREREKQRERERTRE